MLVGFNTGTDSGRLGEVVETVWACDNGDHSRYWAAVPAYLQGTIATIALLQGWALSWIPV